MILDIKEFRGLPPTGNQVQPNAQGFNPFMAGMFGSYFGNNYGNNTGGGVPPASSGFRYRNKKKQLEGSIAGATTPEELSSINEELGTLNSDRDSYQAAGLVSGIPGIASTLLALRDNKQGMNRLKGLNPDSYIPQEIKNSAAEATASAKSAQTSDAAQRKADIGTNATIALNNATTAATSPDQIQQAALQIQRNSNRAINDLGREGTTTQSGRRRYADSLNEKVGTMRQSVKNMIEQQKATLREAQSRNRTQLLEDIGMTALTMGV